MILLLYFASKYRQKFCFIFSLNLLHFYCSVIPFCATNNGEGNSYFFRCIRDSKTLILLRGRFNSCLEFPMNIHSVLDFENFYRFRVVVYSVYYTRHALIDGDQQTLLKIVNILRKAQTATSAI